FDCQPRKPALVSKRNDGVSEGVDSVLQSVKYGSENTFPGEFWASSLECIPSLLTRLALPSFLLQDAVLYPRISCLRAIGLERKSWKSVFSLIRRYNSDRAEHSANPAADQGSELPEIR